MDLESSRNKFICENCEPDARNKANSYCKDCKIFLCKICEQAVHQLRAFRGHTSCSIDHAIIEKLKYCEKHNSVLRSHFCESCNELICQNCQTEGEHYSHSHSIISLTELEKTVPSIGLKQKEIEENIKKVSANANEVRGMVDKLENLFQNFFNEIRKYKNVIIKNYQNEIEKQENTLNNLESIVSLDSSIQNELFVKRYLIIENSKTNLFKEKFKKITKNIEEILVDNMTVLENSLIIERLHNTNIFKPNKFTASKHTKNGDLKISDNLTTVSKVSNDSWKACFVEANDTSKIKFKINRAICSYILLGITEKITLAEENIHTQKTSYSYFSLGNGEFWYESKHEVLSEGFRTGDVIELNYDNQNKTISFFKNTKLIRKQNVLQIKDPCFFVELYHKDDIVSII